MAEAPRNLLKRDSESAKKLSRPQVTVTQPKEEPAKPMPTPDAGVGGSSLDTMTAACATEMMNAAVSFHRLHLKIKGDGSYAAHKALGDFYDGLHDFADTLVEGYQGVAEKLLSYKEMPIRTLDDTADAVSYLRDMYNMVNKLQGMLPYSEIVNNLDLVKDSINSTKYKLLFLK
jgi:DNA-binding ferritin-like protein